MPRHSKRLCENKCSGSIYVRELNPDSRTLEHQRAARSPVQYAIELRYSSGWRAAFVFESRREARDAWHNRSRHWKMRMVAMAEGLKCPVSPVGRERF